MTNPNGIDREGNAIAEGMIVALAVTLNQRLHYTNFSTRICKRKNGKLILDAGMSWGYVADFKPEEMQILHADVDLLKLDVEFMERFGRNDTWPKHISSQEAHDFYVDVVGALKHQTAEFLDVKDHRQAKEILVTLLEMAGSSDEKIKGKVDQLRLRASAMQTSVNNLCREISAMRV
jgi:hypothetical protein